MGGAGLQERADLFSGRACSANGLPLTNTLPRVGRSRPTIIRMIVDFTAPLGPENPVTCPGSTVKVRSSTATLSPYSFRTPCAWNMSVSPRIRVMVSTLDRHPVRRVVREDPLATPRCHPNGGRRGPLPQVVLTPSPGTRLRGRR